MVADTGMHIIGWSEEKTTDFLVESEAPHTKGVDALLDRMAALPAQLTTYDSGAI